MSNYNDLCIYLRNYSGNNDNVEDIVQNVLLKLWEKRAEIQIHTSLKSYLFRSVHHTFIDSYRKTKRVNEKLEALRFNNLHEIIEEDNQLKEQRLLALKKAIEELPPKCKEIFLLSKYQGYRYKEIAERLGISINTVENQISKAFKVLRQKVVNAKYFNLFLSFLKGKFKTD